MNDRLSCALCGAQPCTCVEAECRTCDGEGKVVPMGWCPPYNPTAISPPEPPLITCEDCDGTGSIKCSGPRAGGQCRFGPHASHCYCEAAWERQQEAMAAGDGPPTAREQQLQAQAQRDALRSGVPRG